MPVFCGTELRFGSLCNLGLSKKLRFSLQRHKTAKSCAFCDSLPVSASVCVFAFDTGGLWLWLGAFEKSGLYRCQSAPGPPMPVFCGTELLPVVPSFSCRWGGGQPGSLILAILVNIPS